MPKNESHAIAAHLIARYGDPTALAEAYYLGTGHGGPRLLINDLIDSGTITGRTWCSTYDELMILAA